MTTPADEKSTTTTRRLTWLLPAAFFVIGALITGIVVALLMNIAQRKAEGTQPFFQVVQLTETSFDPAEWGKNFPAQYEGWKNTTQMLDDDKATPPAGDPRAFMAKSKLAEDPRLITMWQGYAFSVEYNHPRGHANMLLDQQLIKRVQAPFKQPGACLNCHASVPEVLYKLNPTDPAAAWAKMNVTPYADATKLAEHPVSCIDCHDPKTMALRVTRPAFVEGIKAYKASLGVANYDVNTMATNNEMRAFVCAQCHVEYYFKGDAKTLTFPWKNGLTASNALDYYDSVGFSDFTNTLTGAKMLKAQHPDYETWSQGVHAANGVTCADCHMPYTRQGAVKVSDHQVRSPLWDDNQINKSCLTCHHETEAVMRARVEGIQSTWKTQQSKSFDALDQLIRDINAAQGNGTPQANIDAARQWQRKAQFFQDYTVSENSKGFHAPQYSLSLVNEATDAARRGQLALRGISEPMTVDPAKDYTPMKATPAPAPSTTAPATPAPAVTPTPIVNPVYSPAAPGATPSK